MTTVIKIEDLDMNEELDREAMRHLIGGASDISSLYGALATAGSATHPGQAYRQYRKDWLNRLKTRK